MELKSILLVVCQALLDAIFGLSTWRGVGGGQEEAFNPSRGVSGRARVVLGVKVFGLKKRLVQVLEEALFVHPRASLISGFRGVILAFAGWGRG
jgi:hypothetical protein